MTKFLSALLILPLYSQHSYATTKPLPTDADKYVLETIRKRFTTPSLRTVPPSMRMSTPKSLSQNIHNGHLIFANQSEAAEWMRAKEDSMKAAFGAEKFQVVENHSYQPVIQKYVDELWVAMTELFPAETDGLTSPPVVIIDAGTTSNAFIDDGGSFVPHAVYVLIGLVDEAKGLDHKEELTGILAHEIGHSVFLHGLQEHRNRIERFYIRDQHTLPFETQPDKDLQTKMSDYLAAARTSGDLSAAQLLNLPSPGYGSPLMIRLWTQLRKELEANSNECRDEVSAMKRWQQLIPFSTLNLEYEVTSPSLLEQASPLLINHSKRCFGQRRIQFSTLLAKALGLDESSLAGSEEVRRFNEIFERSADPISGLQAMVKIERDTMRRIEAAVEFDKLGYYTTEQHADDISAMVHAKLGRNAASFGTFLGVMMDNIRQGDLAACQAVIKKGIPSMGSLQVIHHSYCYRIYHFDLMKERLLHVSDWSSFANQFSTLSVAPGSPPL